MAAAVPLPSFLGALCTYVGSENCPKELTEWLQCNIYIAYKDFDRDEYNLLHPKSGICVSAKVEDWNGIATVEHQQANMALFLSDLKATVTEKQK